MVPALVRRWSVLKEYPELSRVRLIGRTILLNLMLECLLVQLDQLLLLRQYHLEGLEGLLHLWRQYHLEGLEDLLHLLHLEGLEDL